MIKVLVVIGKLCIGGAERVGRDIGYYADLDKFQVDYLVFGEDIGAYEAELCARGCNVIHMDPPSNGYLIFLRNIRKLIKENKYSVIHSHTMFSSGWILMVGSFLRVPKRICHSHSIKGPEKRNIVKNLYENTMRYLIRLFATDYLACGQKAGEWLYGTSFFRNNGNVILNGIDTQKFVFNIDNRNVIRSELGLTDSFIIGHVGHLATVKNQVFLLNLMPTLLQKNPSTKLLLLGEGSDRAMLEEQIEELEIQDHVILTGNVNDVYRYLSAMDVFTFPSLYEGTPLSIIEVQSNGLPCVLSDRVPNDVHLSNLIHVAKLENPNLWVDAILSIKRCANPEKYAAQMKNSGFDFHNMLDKIYSIYER